AKIQPMQRVSLASPSLFEEAASKYQPITQSLSSRSSMYYSSSKLKSRSNNLTQPTTTAFERLPSAHSRCSPCTYKAAHRKTEIKAQQAAIHEEAIRGSP
ncbi:hypothetical protein Dimus_006037, partial [Dionaea muscipula]